MPRVARTLFGSFGGRLSVPVFVNDWWLFQAREVELTETRTSLDLAKCLPEASVQASRKAPEVLDCNWFRAVAPIGLQLRSELVAQSPLKLGLVAARVLDERETSGALVDLAYPFFLVEEAGRFSLHFSCPGPTSALQLEIGVALCRRLLWNESSLPPVV